ncbi:MAG: phosphoglycerate dehydrogenase [Ignavibacteria bacterium]|nr:phosphoglycerate dehydrogenase [Ignavibacteria bacterium]
MDEKGIRILVSDQIEQVGRDHLENEGFRVDFRPGLSPDVLEEVIPQYDALVVRSATQVTAGVIEKGAKLRVIGRAGTGVDNIDVPTATRRGVLVMNTPGGNTVSAAEHTVSMMLALARNIPQAHMSLTGGHWERKKFVGLEVLEKSVGVLGMGKIGREVARRCQGLGMRVLAYDPLMQADAALKLNVELVNLDELFRRADFITVHTPLTADTRGLINDESLSRCKKGVRIVNCARGGIVDEAALLRGLESGIVGGAALDVFEQEPPGESPLLRHPRVVVTPHLGASTEEAQEKVAVQIAVAIADALKGRAYAGVVNASILHMAINEDVRPFLQLAEKIGRLAGQVVDGKIRRLTVSGEGDLVSGSIELLKAGVLDGVLSHFHPDPVNMINAPVLAAEMGIEVRELKRGGGKEFLHSLGVVLETEKDSIDIVGTVFGQSSWRLVKIDGYRIEVNPGGYLLIYRNVDKPGFLARVGSILAETGINIGSVSLGRKKAGETAMTIMSVDDPVPDSVLERLSQLEGVSGLRFVDLRD